MTTTSKPRAGAFASLARAMSSWRTASVALLSFSSGLPLGLVWYAIPDWMRDIGVDIRVVGLFTLAQAPWAFKVIWAPLVDRYVPPFWGRRRGWMAVTQLALAVLGLMLAGVGRQPDALWVVGALALAIALASATQDIAYDAYTVEVLSREEQGAAVGAKTALYRAALLVGGAAITFAARFGWPVVNVLLAAIYVPMLILTWKAPEPQVEVPAPRSLREAVWQPFLGFLARHRAMEILAFVLLYKIADQLAQALTRPFLIDMGYSAYHRGIALASISVAATIAGAFVGGWVTTLAGLGHSLWVFGVLQVFSNLGYFHAVPSSGAEHSVHVRRGRFRAFYFRPWHRRLLGPADPAHTKTILGHSVRTLLESLRVASRTCRANQRIRRRCRRLAHIFPFDDGVGDPGADDAGSIRAYWRARA